MSSLCTFAKAVAFGPASRAGAWRLRTLGLLVALGACTAGHAAPACKLKALELPVTMAGMRAVATVGINGKDVPLTVDSGAFFSFLTDAAAEQLGLTMTHPSRGIQVEGLTGRVDARQTTVKRLRLQKGEIADVEFMVGGNEPGGGTMGVLGRNFLAFTDAEYDLAHGVIRLMFPEGDCKEVNLAYWAGDKPVSELALRRDPSYRTPAIIGAVKVNGEEVYALFDTGAMSTVSLAAARRAGLKDADMTPRGTMLGAGRGEARRWIAPIGKVTIGDEAIQNTMLQIGDFHMDDADMLIGIDFFLSHRIYISKSRHRMFFTYASGPVFSLGTAAQAATPDAEQDAGTEQPQDAAAFARRGAAFKARQAFALALADLDRACELAPDKAEFFMLRAQVHLALKHDAQALQDVDTTLRLDPTNAPARLLRAGQRASVDDRNGALDDLHALDKAVAPQAHVRRDMGDLYLRLDREDLALPQWNQWISAHRNEVTLHEVLNARCWTRTMLNVELDQALKDCDQAVDAQPKFAEYLDSRAWLHLRRGELRDALSDYDRALKIHPDEPWTLYGRGITRTRLGQVEPGRADIAAARARLPSIDTATARHGLSLSDFADRPVVEK